MSEIDGGTLGILGVPDNIRSLRSEVDAPAPAKAAPHIVARASAAPPGLKVEMRGITKAYGKRDVLKQVDLRLAPGEFVAIVGRSGCGKSTLLRLLAGLERPSAGVITLDGAPQARHQSDSRIMFQDARLLPWKRVIDNVALGLAGRDARERAREALAQVGLADRANDWPALLSGGQRQRVALARALVHMPRLLLLDEPLGALDALTRIEMQRLIETLWYRHRFTALLVTHDVAEAVALADRVVLIEEQRIGLDEAVAVARPRSRGNPELAAIEEQVLQRVLGGGAPVSPVAASAALEPAPVPGWLAAM